MARSNARSARSTKVFSSSAGEKKKRPPPAARAQAKQQDTDYTYSEGLPKRHRTGAEKLSLTRDEAAPSGRPAKDSDDEDDMAARIRKVAMMIAGDDAGEVGDDDDEDLDSDEAWEEDGSDEERWGEVVRDMKRGKGKKGKEAVMKPAKPLNVNLDEDSDPEVERSPKTAFKSAFPDEEDESDEDDEDIDEDEEEDEDESDEAFDEDPELPSDLSDDEDADLDDLDAFVTSLSAGDKKRKAEPELEVSKKRRVLPVVSAPGLADGGDLALKNKNKVDLSSLIASAPTLAGASALLPGKNEKKSSSILKAGVLSAPLPTVVQERLDREAAYEKTREEGQKWSGTMKRVKEAEHLSFPLQAQDRGGVKTAGAVIAAFKPENEHESAVHALLASANLTDKGVTAAEDAALRGQELSVEEIAARRQELRYQRELMFRAEAKAKRVAKIKSKTFRKLARKRAAKAAGEGVSLEDLERLDPEAAEEERERLERERARERATLRHGAKGRFGNLSGAGGEMEDRRQAQADMLEARDRLQRKIHARDEDGSDDESDDEEEGDEEDIKSHAFDQLATLNKPEEAGAKKGLSQMAFMKKAEERKLKAVAEETAALKRDIEMFGADSEDEEEDGAAVLKLGEGRMVFGATAPKEDATLPKPAKGKAHGNTPLTRARSPTPPPGAFGDVNPWLSGENSGISRKKNKVATGAEAKAVSKLRKEKVDKVDDDSVEITLDVAPKPARANASKVAEPSKAATSSKPTTAAAPESDSDSESDDDLRPASGVKAFSQRALVAEAFAGDNVVADFAAEKAAVMAADAPKTVDTSLPGWGSWGGKGAKKRRVQAKYLKTQPGVVAEERKDAGRANVIISEKKDKKAAKFLPTDLPYPYTSVAQYEASFAQPVGAEWNARAAFQRGTVPRVTKKPGAIIEPVRKLF